MLYRHGLLPLDTLLQADLYILLDKEINSVCYLFTHSSHFSNAMWLQCCAYCSQFTILKRLCTSLKPCESAWLIMFHLFAVFLFFLAYAFICLFIYLFILSFIRLFVQSLCHSFIDLFIYLYTLIQKCGSLISFLNKFCTVWNSLPDKFIVNFLHLTQHSRVLPWIGAQQQE